MPRTVTRPSVLVISPSTALRSELLPAPTRPTTARSSPFLRLRLISTRVASALALVFQLNSPCTTEMSSSPCTVSR